MLFVLGAHILAKFIVLTQVHNPSHYGAQVEHHNKTLLKHVV